MLKLRELVSPERIGVSVRDPAKAVDLAARGVRVQAGDFADRASREAAVEGAERVLSVASHAAASGGDPSGRRSGMITSASAPSLAVTVTR